MEELLGQVALRFSRLPMFPFFDLAHYAASVLSLKEQPGEGSLSSTPLFSFLNCMLHARTFYKETQTPLF
uniref:Uncharacterized protein n=1 Tax=Podarcis muralis TaxID=64176 RepID=A0A670KC13_PODMU